jgi:hypothetical protein
MTKAAAHKATRNDSTMSCARATVPHDRQRMSLFLAPLSTLNATRAPEVSLGFVVVAVQEAVVVGFAPSHSARLLLLLAVAGKMPQL